MYRARAQESELYGNVGKKSSQNGGVRRYNEKKKINIHFDYSSVGAAKDESGR
jgi:hypothetical protein